jgi:hypothetical protein
MSIGCLEPSSGTTFNIRGPLRGASFAYRHLHDIVASERNHSFTTPPLTRAFINDFESIWRWMEQMEHYLDIRGYQIGMKFQNKTIESMAYRIRRRVLYGLSIEGASPLVDGAF